MIPLVNAIIAGAIGGMIFNALRDKEKDDDGTDQNGDNGDTGNRDSEPSPDDQQNHRLSLATPGVPPEIEPPKLPTESVPNEVPTNGAAIPDDESDRGGDDFSSQQQSDP